MKFICILSTIMLTLIVLTYAVDYKGMDSTAYRTYQNVTNNIDL